MKKILLLILCIVSVNTISAITISGFLNECKKESGAHCENLLKSKAFKDSIATITDPVCKEFNTKAKKYDLIIIPQNPSDFNKLMKKACDVENMEFVYQMPEDSEKKITDGSLTTTIERTADEMFPCVMAITDKDGTDVRHILIFVYAKNGYTLILNYEGKPDIPKSQIGKFITLNNQMIFKS